MYLFNITNNIFCKEYHVPCCDIWDAGDVSICIWPFTCFQRETKYVIYGCLCCWVWLGYIFRSKIERKLAIGYVYTTINTQNKNEELVKFLRNEGFAVTIYIGEGRDSNRYKYEILTKRNREGELFQIVEQFEPNAFIISYEPKSFKGGFYLLV